MEAEIGNGGYEADGTYTIWSPTQGIFPTRSGVAAALGLNVSDVRVIQEEVGGGFGGKMLLLEPLVALLSRMTSPPLRPSLSGNAEVLIGPRPPPFWIHLPLGRSRARTT